MRKRLRIAFLTSEYVTEPSYDGGLANYLFRVGQGLKKLGHEVEIFTRSDRDEDMIHHDILIHRIKIKQGPLFKNLRRFTRYRFSQSLDSALLSYRLKKGFLRRHRQCPFDIIQASSYLSTGMFFTMNRPVPVVTRVSSYEPLWRTFYKKSLSLDQYIVEWMELFTMRRSNAVYAPSRLLAGAVEANKNLKVDVLHPPFSIETAEVDENIYRRHLAGKKYLLFFGNVGFLKGCEVLGSSLSNVFSFFPEMVFVFLGRVHEGPQNQSMLEYIVRQAGKYEKQIMYLGILPHSQLYPVIANAHAVVLPSLVDNIPNTMLEAMAMGKVVIGTRGASFDEFIEDGISGILVEPSNHEELSRAMHQVWTMGQEERENIGKAARERIFLLNPDLMCRNLEGYYLGVIQSWEASTNYGRTFFAGEKSQRDSDE